MRPILIEAFTILGLILGYIIGTIKIKKGFPTETNGLYFAISKHTQDDPQPFDNAILINRGLIISMLLQLFLKLHPGISKFTIKTKRINDLDELTHDISITF